MLRYSGIQLTATAFIFSTLFSGAAVDTGINPPAESMIQKDSMELRMTAEDWAGDWHVQLTDFPMWLKGKRKNPVFTYAPGTRKDKPGMLDKVSYHTLSGKKKEIKGFDYVLDDAYTSFEWRGNGILSLFKSNWRLVYISPEKDWAIIHFRKTAATPEGVDVISRALQPDEATLNRMKGQLALYFPERTLQKTLR